MAISLFTPTYSFKFSSNLPHRPSIPNPSCSFRFRAVPESSSRRSPTTPSQDPETLSRDDKVESLPTSSGSDSFSGLRKLLKVDGLVLEILSIALPAALALAADPLTSLVDTAFVGHLGAVELAAVGVSVSVFNLVSKLFNVPLLNITTSFVAEEQALVAKELGDNQIKSDHVAGCQNKIILPSVSTSLALAAGLGIAEAVALFFGSGFLMTSMGITDDSPIRVPAEQFLILRAFGAPPIVIAQAAQGTFRGFKDTKTPLFAVDCTLATCHSSEKI